MKNQKYLHSLKHRVYVYLMCAKKMGKTVRWQEIASEFPDDKRSSIRRNYWGYDKEQRELDRIGYDMGKRASQLTGSDIVVAVLWSGIIVGLIVGLVNVFLNSFR